MCLIVCLLVCLLIWFFPLFVCATIMHVLFCPCPCLSPLALVRCPCSPTFVVCVSLSLSISVVQFCPVLSARTIFSRPCMSRMPLCMPRVSRPPLKHRPQAPPQGPPARWWPMFKFQTSLPLALALPHSPPSLPTGHPYTIHRHTTQPFYPSAFSHYFFSR